MCIMVRALCGVCYEEDYKYEDASRLVTERTGSVRGSVWCARAPAKVPGETRGFCKDVVVDRIDLICEECRGKGLK